MLVNEREWQQEGEMGGDEERSGVGTGRAAKAMHARAVGHGGRAHGW